MAGNTFGQLFTVTSFGESHGPALGCVVDGCPPGLELDEEDIQREKLKGATEIAEGLRDVQETFDEFGRLIQHQQVGLDNMEKNVDNSVKHTQKGTENLRGANKEQKKSRKCMFILIGILAVLHRT